MEGLLFYLLVIFLVPKSVFISAENVSNATVKDVDFRGRGKFPAKIDVILNYDDVDVHLMLQRDDGATEMLSEELFHTSRILPSRLFKDGERNNFAAYGSGKSDILIVHRETTDAKPKFYGRFTHNNSRQVINAEDGSYVRHRVKRDLSEQKAQRYRRSDTDDIIELFIFADLSVYEHISTELLPGKKEKEIKKFVKNYLTATAKEVDTIYQYLGKNGGIGNIRVYLQQYQTITASRQQKWVQDNLSNGKLQTTSTTDLQAYYSTLITKFAFPYTDHLVALTKLDMEGDVQVMTTGTMCGASSAIATSIVRIDSFPVSLARGIALTFNIQSDGDGNNCLISDQYVMSTNYGAVTDSAKQGNRWKFSSCSVDQFKNALSGGLDLSCLQEQDKIFDFDAYQEAAYISELLTLDEQCTLRYQAGSTFCDETLGDAVDCFSPTQGCTDNGACAPFTVPQLTPCDTGTTSGNNICSFGFCYAINTTVSTTEAPLPSFGSSMMIFSSSLSVTTTTESKTTIPPAFQTTTTAVDCTPEISYEDYNLPGCNCQGCNVKSENGNDNCLKAPECDGRKVRVVTKIIPESCISLYEPGPTRVIMTASEAQNTDLKAEVYKESNGDWKAELIKTP